MKNRDRYLLANVINSVRLLPLNPQFAGEYQGFGPRNDLLRLRAC